MIEGVSDVYAEQLKTDIHWLRILLCIRGENSSAFRSVYKFRNFDIQSLRRCTTSCVPSFAAVIPCVELFQSSTQFVQKAVASALLCRRPFAQIEFPGDGGGKRLTNLGPNEGRAFVSWSNKGRAGKSFVRPSNFFEDVERILNTWWKGEDTVKDWGSFFFREKSF
ncbi:hypothetical protein TNCV_3629601 [Trichonephila clavipes]|nr:hypothetical protein TNCV_3629601 [Trichonephila clavipes]